MWYRRFLLVAVLVLVAVVGVYAQQTNRVVGGTDADLRAFIQYYIGAVDDTTAVTIGTVADDIPFELPLPAGATVLGSIDRGVGYNMPGSRYIEIFVETMTAPADVAAFYETTLTDDAWLKFQSGYTPPSGFNPFSNAYGSYCYNDGEASLNYDVYGTLDDPMRMSLRVTIPADPYMCSEQGENLLLDPVARLVPVLTPVDGVTVKPQSGGNYIHGPNMGSVGAALTLDVPLDTAMNVYNAQLTAAGWELVNRTDQDDIAISRWRITADDDSEWVGTFTMFQSGADSTDYKSLVLVEQVLADE